MYMVYPLMDNVDCVDIKNMKKNIQSYETTN